MNKAISYSGKKKSVNTYWIVQQVEKICRNCEYAKKKPSRVFLFRSKTYESISIFLSCSTSTPFEKSGLGGWELKRLMGLWVRIRSTSVRSSLELRMKMSISVCLDNLKTIVS